MNSDKEPLDPDVLAFFEQTNKSLRDLSDEVRFLLALTEKNLRIQIKLAYVLERISNRVYELDDPEAVSGEAIEAEFAEIRGLFDAQLEIMRGEADK